MLIDVHVRQVVRPAIHLRKRHAAPVGSVEHHDRRTLVSPFFPPLRALPLPRFLEPALTLRHAQPPHLHRRRNHLHPHRIPPAPKVPPEDTHGRRCARWDGRDDPPHFRTE